MMCGVFRRSVNYWAIGDVGMQLFRARRSKTVSMEIMVERKRGERIIFQRRVARMSSD